MAEQIVGVLCTMGFVVKNYRGRFLSRSHKWVRHQNGNEHRAYVHSREALLAGGGWVQTDAEVLPASYDPVSDRTSLIAGTVMSYEEFCEEHQDSQLS